MHPIGCMLFLWAALFNQIKLLYGGIMTGQEIDVYLKHFVLLIPKWATLMVVAGVENEIMISGKYQGRKPNRTL